ncbi:hypothetical protein OC834_007366, partial [Tilletia horrida]
MSDFTSDSDSDMSWANSVDAEHDASEGTPAPRLSCPSPALTSQPADLIMANFTALTALPPLAEYSTLAPRRDFAKNPWRRVVTVPTRFLYQWFEAQRNDFSSHDSKMASCIQLYWIGHPGDSPKDVSARAFSPAWTDDVSKSERARLIKEGGIVYRHHFECLGMCGQEAQDTEQSSCSEAGSEAEDKGPARRSSRAALTKRASSVCRDSVKLLVEISAKDITKCIVYQRGHHAEVQDPSQLQYSRRLRLHLLEMGSRSGMTAAKLKKDPFVAVDLFAAANPDSVFAYQPLHITKKTKRFSIGIKTRWSLQNLIRHVDHPLYMDSSWRNKNENRAPLTFITTHNSALHMVPCAAYLSADATADAFAHLLRHLAEEVLAEATLLCELDIDQQLALNEPTLLLNAHRIVGEGFWQPSSVMIDKCRAELNAILSVWPDMQIRVCQFHIMQAICRWDSESKTVKSKAGPSSGSNSTGSSLALSKALGKEDKASVCFAFRTAQRCRHESDWPATQASFASDVRRYLKHRPAAAVDQVLTYFEVNWWTEPWRSRVTDIGLGAGQTRDNFNTNNTIERAFKTFDDIFLACRVNKRIDRLVHVLACDWLVFYERYSSEEPRLSSMVRDTMLEAHRLWEARAVSPMNQAGTSFSVLGLSINSDKGAEPKVYKISLAASHLRCTCLAWRQSGKLCSHMHAARIYSTMGDVIRFHEAEQEGIPSLRQASEGLARAGESDSTITDHLERVWKRFQQLPAAQMKQTPPTQEPFSSPLDLHMATDGPTAEPVSPALNLQGTQAGPPSAAATASSVDRSGAFNPSSRSAQGRPAKVKPLHNRRHATKTKSSSALRFSSAPGPTRQAPWKAGKTVPSQQSEPKIEVQTSLSYDARRLTLQALNRVQQPPPTNALEAQISAMSESTALKAKVGAYADQHLVLEDFQGMRPGAWITGTTISLYGQKRRQDIIERTRSKSAVGSTALSTMLIGPSTYKSPCSEVHMSTRVNDWYPEKRILDFTQIIAPINSNNTHWAVAIIRPKERSINFVDSQPSPALAAQVEFFFRTFLSQRAEKEHGAHSDSARTFNADAWNFWTPGSDDKLYPIQGDGHSCGLIACK